MDVRRCFLFLLLPSFFFWPSNSQSSDSFTSVLVSQNGLDFVKNLLVNKAIASIIPLQIPRIEKSVRIPFLGGIDVVVSNLTIYELDVASSYVKLGETGVVIVASGTTCNLSMNWHYTYSTWLPPIEISDQGIASVQVIMIFLLIFDLPIHILSSDDIESVQIEAKARSSPSFFIADFGGFFCMYFSFVFVFESVDSYRRLKIRFSPNSQLLLLFEM